MIRGKTIEVSLNPSLAKDIDSFEATAPVQIDMRNVRITDAGNLVKRKGYATKWDTSNENKIVSLIPKSTGYAIDSKGNIYKLGNTITNLHSLSNITSKPSWYEWNKSTYIFTGVAPVKITDFTVETIGTIPYAKFVALIGTYSILSGYHPTEFSWSVPGNPESYLIAQGGGFTNIEKTGTIKNMIEFRKRLYFFKETEIEVWGFTGTTIPFRRQTGQTIDIGLGAVDSVVKTDDTFFWFGDDGDFYAFDGSTGRNISENMRARVDDLNNRTELIGEHIRKENIIKWTSPTDGMSLLYDYKKGIWLEDNRWENGWQSLPFLSYMELDNKQYFGSRNYDGLIHEWSSDNKDDNGQPIRVMRRLRVPLGNGNKSRVHRVRFRRKGGLVTTAVTAPVFTVRWRLDNKDWNLCTPLTLGTLGDYEPYVDLNNLGIGRELEIELVESDAVDYLLTDMLITAEALRV